MDTLTAEQKVRLQLTGDPFTDPHFQHEGERWCIFSLEAHCLEPG